MAASNPKIKQEQPDDGYSCNDVTAAGSAVTYAHFSTPVTSSSREANSAASGSEEDGSPAAKRSRRGSGDQVLQNGHHYAGLSLGAHGKDKQRRLRLGPAYEHYEGSHSSLILNGLNEQRIREQFVDLVLVVQGRELACHKVVLCSASEYFFDLSTSFPSTSSRNLQRIHINDASYEIVARLLEFAYTSRIKITEENIDQLFSTATNLKFTTVRDACIMVLKQRLTPQNCIAVKRFAAKQNCKSLSDSATTFVQENFAEVRTSDDFLNLNLKELLGLISSENLNVNQEEMVYEAVMTWVRYDVTVRKQFLPKIFEHVRLPLVKPQFLLDVVQSDPLVKNVKECETFLDEARRFQLLADQRPLMQSERTQPRVAYSFKKTEVLVTIGGLNKDKIPIQDCVYFDYPNPVATSLAPLKLTQTAYSVAAVNNNIFVTGGACNSPCKEVWMYIPSLNRWRQVAPMSEARYLHASVAFQGHLCVVGGHGGSSRLKSVEKYNPDTNTWSDVEPMLMELSSPAVVACDGMVYVIGGANGQSPSDIVSDVQCYNPKSSSWKRLAPLPQPERGALAANLNGTIYVMGQHKSVFSYNRKSNKWLKLRNTIGGHLHGAAAVHRGQLYVAGGLHGNSYINGTVETYDYVTDEWHVTSTLHVPVYAQGFVSIFKDGSASSDT